jgi:hypothetical protein
MVPQTVQPLPNRLVTRKALFRVPLLAHQALHDLPRGQLAVQPLAAQRGVDLEERFDHFTEILQKAREALFK